MKTPRITLIIYLLIWALTCAIASAQPERQPERSNTLNEILAAYGSGFNAGGDFPVISNFKNSAQGKVFNTITAEKGGKRIQLEITSGMTANEALAYSRTQYTVVQHLYGPRQIQYPGIITNHTECPDNKKPRETTIAIMGKPAKVLLANASERYVLGVWDDDLISQKAAFAVFYDGKNAVSYQIIVFQPYDDPNRKELLSILEGFKIR
jgi:hypothetical protein